MIGKHKLKTMYSLRGGAPSISIPTARLPFADMVPPRHLQMDKGCKAAGMTGREVTMNTFLLFLVDSPTHALVPHPQILISQAKDALVACDDWMARDCVLS